MTWEEAKKQLRKGNIVKRKCWRDGKHLHLEGNMITCSKPYDKHGKFVSWFVNFADIELFKMFDDWMVA